MALIPYRRREPNELTRLHDEMDNLLGTFFGDWGRRQHELWPAIKVSENENALQVQAEVPGCKPENIDISVHGSTLTISGEKKHEEKKEEKGYYYNEQSYGSFRRDISLPSEVEPDKVDAKCSDGVLTVNVPKAEKAKPFKVKVKAQ